MRGKPGFRANGNSRFFQHPAVFAGDLFVHRALQGGRQDTPSIGLDLVMPARLRVFPPPCEHLADLIARRAQRRRSVRHPAGCGNAPARREAGSRRRAGSPAGRGNGGASPASSSAITWWKYVGSSNARIASTADRSRGSRVSALERWILEIRIPAFASASREARASSCSIAKWQAS